MERDSQASPSSDSLSLVSEPQDVRNWFSSYVYESPILGTDENFGCPVLNESEIRNLCHVLGNGRQEKVGVSYEFDEAGNVDQLNGDEKRELDFGRRREGTAGRDVNEEELLTEAPDSSQSSLPDSESGDIGLIFGREVPTSPDLHEECAAFISQVNGRVGAKIDDGPKDSEAKEDKSSAGTLPRGELTSEHVKTDVSAADINHDKDEHSREVSGYSSSSSFLSEPPHISNWFSSYVYESPEIDTLRDLGCIGNGCNEKDDLLIGEISNSKKEFTSLPNHEKTNVDAYTKPKLIPPTIRSPRKNSQVNIEPKETIEPRSDVQVGGLVKKVKSECIVVVAPIDNLQGNNELLSSNGSGSCMSPIKEISRYPVESSYIRNSTKLLSGVKLQSDSVSPASTRGNPGLCAANRDLTRTRNCRFREKENLEPCSRDSGFVATRKKAALDIGPGSKPGDLVSKQCLHAKRTSLAETRNLPTRQEDAVEYAGKWRCPQKRKPYVAPAMKQLRLDRWL